MKYIICPVSFVIIGLLMVGLWGCGKKTDTEQRWRVSNKREYTLDIAGKNVFSSLNNFEKFLTAPLGYFESAGKIGSFTQSVTMRSTAMLEGEKKELALEDTVSYKNDKKGSWIMNYRNNHSEGWEMIWKDGFLYRKILGGEFVKTYSMGEHDFYREKLFGVLPDIYLLLRDNAELENVSSKIVDGKKHTVAEIRFTEKRTERTPLHEKQYLQNTIGIREMEVDSLLQTFAGREKTGVTGSCTVTVDSKLVIRELSCDATFVLSEDNVTMRITGNRTISDESYSMISAPICPPEYHRRTMDAARNIMEGE